MFWSKKSKAPKSHAREITEANFKEVVMQSDKPVLIDFWAPWCGPCKVLGPIVDELSGEYEGKAIIGKINTEQQQHLAATFQIKSIPTLLVFNEGKMVERFTGVVPKPNLEEILNDYIDSPASS
jgi:thioredoxin 1